MATVSKERVKELLQKVMIKDLSGGNAEIDDDDLIEGLGIDSLALLEFSGNLETELVIEPADGITQEEWSQFLRVKDIYDYLAGRGLLA